MKRRASLRAMMAAVTLIVTVFALLVAGALVVLTTALHRATTSSASSVESVRLAGLYVPRGPADEGLRCDGGRRDTRRRTAIALTGARGDPHVDHPGAS